MTVASEQAIRAPAASAARVLIVLQTILGGLYLWALVLLLLAALRYGSFGFSPFGEGDMRDPKDVLGPGDALGGILHAPVFLVVLLGLPFSIGAAFLGIPVIVLQRRAGHLSKTLLVSTAIMLVVVAIQVTPFGDLMRLWMLD